MAIWQYKGFILPKELVDSFFEREAKISENDFDNINWWGNYKIGKQNFIVAFGHLIHEEKSWSDEIIQFGNLSSTCIEVIYENNEMVEVSFRIDLRKSFTSFLIMLESFLKENDCYALNSNLLILGQESESIKQDIYDFYCS